MDHVSLTVSDVDRSVEFYVKAFGMTKTRRYAAEGSEVDAVVGYAKVILEIAWLQLDGVNVELIQYVSPDGQHPRLETKDVGTPHLAFHTDDIERDYNRLVEMGAKFRNPPRRQARSARATAGTPTASRSSCYSAAKRRRS